MHAPRSKVFLPRVTAGQYERQTCGVPVAGDAGGSPRAKKTGIRHIYATVITSNPFERDDLFPNWVEIHLPLGGSIGL